MKLSELFLTEEQILSFPINEMANLFPSKTGLPVAIWMGEVGGQHGPRIKVSNIKGKFSSSDNFVISVSKNPQVLTPKYAKLSSSEIEDIKDWIKLNLDDLMDMWEAYETGNDLTDILPLLRKI